MPATHAVTGASSYDYLTASFSIHFRFFDNICMHVLVMSHNLCMCLLCIYLRCLQFFERIEAGNDADPSPDCDLRCTCATADGRVIYVLKRPQNNREAPKPRSLADIIGVYTGGPHGRRKGENGHTQDKYLEFLSFIQ
jgi:hypothetical protein